MPRISEVLKPLQWLSGMVILSLISGLSGLAAKNNEAELYAAQTRAEELESQEQFYNAIEVWQRVLHETPHSSRAYLGIARSYMRLARYNEALGFVEQALLLANQDYPISILKSRILMGLQRYDEAKEILLKLKEIHPSFQVDLALSELFVILGDVAQGVEYLNAIKSFAGNDLHFLLTSLMVYEEAGKLDHADRYLRQVLDSYYNEAVVHKVAAGYYLRRGRYGDVLEEIDIIKRLGIDSENLRLLGLEAAYLKGDFQLAINLAETLVTLYPKNSEAWYLLGLGYSNTAQLEKALHALNTARRIDPDNEFVKIVIAEILRTRYPYPSEWHSREGKRYVASAQVKRDNLLYKKALQDYRSALQIDPLNEENWMSFANVFRDRGHYAKYLDKLYAWREFGVPKAEGVESKLAELIRIYEASQSQNVAQKWGLQQYAFPNNFYPVRVFVVKGSSFDYVGATRELGSYFVNVLQWYEQPFVVGDIQMVDDRLQAQQAAHVGGSSDYYIILDFTRQAGGLRSEVALYLSSTGRQVAQYVAERVSNGKIYNSFVYLAAQLQELFPKKASVVEVKVNDVVLSLGSLDGVEKGQKWLVLPESALRQSVGNPFGEYKESDVIGTVTIEQADEKISGGKVQLNSFIRPVEKGYIALQWQERETTEEERANPTLLQEPNIGLQNRFFELS